MLKAIFYLLLIYFGYKIYKAVSQTRVVIRNFNYYGNEQQRNSSNNDEININSQTQVKSRIDKNGKKGEYVDFEEVD